MLNIHTKIHAKRMWGLLIAALLMGSLSFTVQAGSLTKKVNSDPFGVAIKGYDPVAYFTDGHAVKGTREYVYEWNNAKWYFKDDSHRNLFAADPERYAPRYGGYCAATLASTGEAAGVDPQAFKIIDGKLYLSWNKKLIDKFADGGDKAIQTADENWSKINQ